MSDGRLERWEALVYELPAAAADESIGRLSDLGRGAALEPAGRGRTRVRLYLRTTTPPGAALDAARAVLADCDPRPAEPRLETVEDGRWVERYQASLRPFDLGAGFRVYPAGRIDPAEAPSGAPSVAGRQPLLLVPGRAFGTGEHPTTRLCTAALERRVERGSRWIDLGCGSGILTLVALRCGAAGVLALDLDPEAVEVARESLAANGVAPAGGAVELRAGTAADVDSAGWDGVAANIHAPIFLDEAPRIARLLRPGGLLVASGFPADQAGEVEAALERAGLGIEERATEPPWAALVARRAEG